MHISSILLWGEEEGWREAGGWGRGVWPGGRPRNRLFSNGQLPIIPAVINHRRLTNEVEQSARDGTWTLNSHGSSTSHCLLSSDWNVELRADLERSNSCSISHSLRHSFIGITHQVISDQAINTRGEVICRANILHVCCPGGLRAAPLPVLNFSLILQQ